MTHPIAATAVPSVLRVHADELPEGAPGQAGYRALLCGPAGSGSRRETVLPGTEPHDLVVVEYGDSGYRRAWLRGETTGDGVLYLLLGELPGSFPTRSPAGLG